MTEEKESRIEKEIKGKGCFRQTIILIIIFIFGWYGYLYFRDRGDVDQFIETRALPQELTGEIDTTDWLTFNSTTGTDLKFAYSPGWELSSETVDGNEFSSFRSPTDENGFYFCLDLKEYSPNYSVDLGMTANVLLAEDFTTEGIGKPLSRIVYQSPSLGDFHLSLIDDTAIKEGDNISYTESIINPFGWSLMIQARYNCDDEAPPQLELNTFENSQSVQETLRAFRTLRY